MGERRKVKFLAEGAELLGRAEDASLGGHPEPQAGFC